jgi:hypothetical protein
MNLSSEQYQALASIALGIGLIVWPPPKQGDKEQRRQARLAELASGAPERYFDERRELEAYGPRSAGPFRALGVLMVLIGGAVLFVG